MDFNELPNELLKTIITFLDIKSAKNIASCSERMYDLALDRIWSKPRFRGAKKRNSFFEKIKKFPIQELHTEDFLCRWGKIAEVFPDLKLLHIDGEGRKEPHTFPKVVEIRKIKVPMALYSKLFRVTDDDMQMRFFLEKGLTYKYISQLVFEEDVNAGETIVWSLEAFKLAAKITFISKVQVNCLDIQSSCDLNDFLDDISMNKKTELHLPAMKYGMYKFTRQDIESIVSRDIRIVSIDSNSLSFDDTSSGFEHWIPILNKLKYLEEFILNHPVSFQEELPPISLLKHLPIRKMNTSHFNFHKESIQNVVKTMLKMRHLESVIIDEASNWHWEYKFSPDEILLFKSLPVKSVSLYALNLTKENVEIFRRIICEIMEIETIKGFDQFGRCEETKELGISKIMSRGPFGIFKSI
eukprot:TCONS_00059603-protein